MAGAAKHFIRANSQNKMQEEYDYRYCELYYFQNGYPVETVRLTPQDTYINVTVRKRFINNFINIPERYR